MTIAALFMIGTGFIGTETTIAPGTSGTDIGTILIAETGKPRRLPHIYTEMIDIGICEPMTGIFVTETFLETGISDTMQNIGSISIGENGTLQDRPFILIERNSIGIWNVRILNAKPTVKL